MKVNPKKKKDKSFVIISQFSYGFHSGYQYFELISDHSEGHGRESHDRTAPALAVRRRPHRTYVEDTGAGRRLAAAGAVPSPATARDRNTGTCQIDGGEILGGASSCRSRDKKVWMGLLTYYLTGG